MAICYVSTTQTLIGCISFHFSVIDGRSINYGLIDESDMARPIKLNLAGKTGQGYELTVPTFTKDEWTQLRDLLSPLALDIQKELDTVVTQIWHEFHRFVPEHLHDQINQYLAGYVNSLVTHNVFEMMERGQLAPPPEHGPLSYWVCFVSGD